MHLIFEKILFWAIISLSHLHWFLTYSFTCMTSNLVKPQERGISLLGKNVSVSWMEKFKRTQYTFYGEGSGTPLQCSCLENPRDRGAWWAVIYGVAQSQTRLKWVSSSSTHSKRNIYGLLIYLSQKLGTLLFCLVPYYNVSQPDVSDTIITNYDAFVFDKFCKTLQINVKPTFLMHNEKVLIVLSSLIPLCSSQISKL